MARGGTVNVRSTAEPTAELRRSFGLRTAAATAGLLSTFLLTVVGVRTLDPGDAAVLLSVLAALSIGPLLGRLGLGPNLIRLLPTEPDTATRHRGRPPARHRTAVRAERSRRRGRRDGGVGRPGR